MADMRRRQFLQTGVAATGALALAGCLGSNASGSGGDDKPAWVRENAVFVPEHATGMEMVGTAREGRYRAALTYSSPHAFYLVRETTVERAGIQPADATHAMVSVWDGPTDTVVPAANIQTTFRRDGEVHDRSSLWPMLSQPMGLHFGDNVTLPGDGEYTVEVTVSPTSARRTGELRDALGERASFEFSFAFDDGELDRLPLTLPNDIGDRDAISPVEMAAVPTAQLPPTEAFPARVRGEATSADCVFVVATAGEPPAGVTGTGPYLVVSARTPHNRYPLALMSLSARLDRDGTTVFEGTPTPTLDPELGYHYGAVLGDVDPGDQLTLSVDSPPQLARHDGYQTAFLEMSDVTLTV
jgi:hypothetical protein